MYVLIEITKLLSISELSLQAIALNIILAH